MRPPRPGLADDAERCWKRCVASAQSSSIDETALWNCSSGDTIGRNTNWSIRSGHRLEDDLADVTLAEGLPSDQQAAASVAVSAPHTVEDVGAVDTTDVERRGDRHVPSVGGELLQQSMRVVG